MAIACFGEGHLLCLYPFNVFELSQLPFVHSLGSSAGVDVVSPYGYGGATYEGGGDDLQSTKESLKYALQSFFAQINVVSEFVREDLFTEHLTPRYDGERLVLQQNVAIDLKATPEERWLRYRPQIRKNVRHAEAAGLSVAIGDGEVFLEPFLETYYATMRRRHARDYYYFTRDKFRRLHDSLQPTGGLQYALASLQERVVSVQLVLLSADTMYAFLSGTDAAYFKLHSVELLTHRLVTWGHDRGYSSLVLGGGLIPGDGLFQFKRAFEPAGLVDFCVRRVVWNRKQYDLLVAEREEWEMEKSRTWRPQPSFFPTYRSDSTTEEPSPAENDVRADNEE